MLVELNDAISLTPHELVLFSVPGVVKLSAVQVFKNVMSNYKTSTEKTKNNFYKNLTLSWTLSKKMQKLSQTAQDTIKSKLILRY